ncbi:hypothetical protein SAMN06269173_105275 [Hymenobacter mucosus]|uniref:Uncharacterized protein n=1 Tax=Hymenobacter mucosus TaxID=1411120 RepID=A0A238YIT0_9BACT|nr:hypothetical protein SAMN06269173_105275 [Hymenobacter mucosus]
MTRIFNCSAKTTQYLLATGAALFRSPVTSYSTPNSHHLEPSEEYYTLLLKTHHPIEVSAQMKNMPMKQIATTA